MSLDGMPQASSALENNVFGLLGSRGINEMQRQWCYGMKTDSTQMVTTGWLTPTFLDTAAYAFQTTLNSKSSMHPAGNLPLRGTQTYGFNNAQRLNPVWGIMEHVLSISGIERYETWWGLDEVSRMETKAGSSGFYKEETYHILCSLPLSRWYSCCLRTLLARKLPLHTASWPWTQTTSQNKPFLYKVVSFKYLT